MYHLHFHYQYKTKFTITSFSAKHKLHKFYSITTFTSTPVPNVKLMFVGAVSFQICVLFAAAFVSFKTLYFIPLHLGLMINMPIRTSSVKSFYYIIILGTAPNP